MSPKAAALLSELRAELAAFRAQQAALPPPKDVAEDLSRRARLDAVARDGVTDVMRSDLSQVEKGHALQQLFEEIVAIDADNTRALTAALPQEGWFTRSKYGEKVGADAWLIVQHSPDTAFQQAILNRIEPLVATGEINPRDYALLFDRVQVKGNRPQRYASQAHCVSGAWGFLAVEDISAVDQRRAAIGWTETLTDTEARLRIGASC
ncbi:MAG: hypothetical protein C0481_02785 [Phenylobacterium sp.]|nr:hypothetical protein [Phenylobacterium sp.]